MAHRYSLWLITMTFLCVPLLNAQNAPSASRSGEGYLGVQIQDVSRKIEKRFKLPSDEGAYIAEVVDDSPAERAGLKEDDVVLSFDGRPVYDADDLTRFVQRTKPEVKVDVVVWRDAAKKTIAVTVGKKKDQSFAFFRGSGDHPGNVMFWSGRPSYGLELNTLNEQLGSYFGVPDKKGVLVESVKKGSSAEKAGFEAGDVITKVGTETVSESMEVARELADYEEGDKVDIEVYRKGSRKTLTIEVEEGDDDAQFYFHGFGDGAIRMPRMINIPAPDVRVRIHELDEDRLQEAQKRLDESLDGLRKDERRLKESAPVIGSLKKHLTI